MRTLTRDLQQSLSPQKALEILKEGNKRFVNNLRESRNLLQQVNETCHGQYPFATILSCIDSRTSAELIFDQGLGDIFSIRIAGNVLNQDILGCMEFGCKVAGSKVLVVLGHTSCGAVVGACNNMELDNFTPLINKIKPSVKKIEGNYKKGQIPERHTFYSEVATENVKQSVEQIRRESSILNDMECKGEIIIAGGLHNLQTGEVEFFDHQSPCNPQPK